VRFGLADNAPAVDEFGLLFKVRAITNLTVPLVILRVLNQQRVKLAFGEFVEEGELTCYNS
jgi:hypothetical protein